MVLTTGNLPTGDGSGGPSPPPPPPWHLFGYCHHFLRNPNYITLRQYVNILLHYLFIDEFILYSIVGMKVFLLYTAKGSLYESTYWKKDQLIYNCQQIVQWLTLTNIIPACSWDSKWQKRFTCKS